MKLKEITKTLDEFFQLNALDMDPSMKNFIPMVYDPIGFKRKNFFEKDFCSRFNGLMIKGWEEVNTIFLSVFPSEEVLENFIKKSQAGDLLFLHHPIFMSSWDPKGNTWTFFHPIDQRKRFNLQQELIDRGDNEAMMADWEFVEMLEHGMPPTCGFGFGERLFAFLCNKPVRETTLFPLMKPKKED